MCKNNYKKSVSGLIVISFLLMILMPQESFAKWHRQGDLPGMSDSEMITTTILIVGGAILVFYLAKKIGEPHKRSVAPADSTQGTIKADSTEKILKLNYYRPGGNYRFVQKSKVNHNSIKKQLFPFVGLKSDHATIPSFANEKNELKKQTIIVGLIYNF